LSSPSSTDDATLSLDDDSSVLSAAMLEQQDGTDLGVDPLGPLALLDDIQTLDADSLALAVGILRQHQPVDAAEEGVQLSERLRDFLMVLRKRPATSAAGEACLGIGAGNATSILVHTVTCESHTLQVCWCSCTLHPYMCIGVIECSQSGQLGLTLAAG
jgi:hypothetical protein